MRLVFMGTPAFAVPALEALVAAGHEVACVYSQPPRPAGRGKKPRPSPVALRAEALGLRVRTPERLRGEAEAIRNTGAAAGVVVAYGLILPAAVLETLPLGFLNIHASLLPRWRGAAPIQRAILAGDRETGVAIMGMEAGLDTGPVWQSTAVPIGPEETAGDLSDRLAVLGARLVVDTLARRDALVPAPQPDAGVTYAAKIDKAEARVDWSRPSPEVDRLIRGLSPVPGAWCDAAGERLRLLRSRHVDASGTPGAVLPGQGLRVACGTGAIEILLAQRAGRKPMMPADLVRGWALPERLG